MTSLINYITKYTQKNKKEFEGYNKQNYIPRLPQFSSNMTPKKYKQYTTLLTLFLALFFIINQKHYIEKLINNFFYIEETTLQPN